MESRVGLKAHETGRETEATLALPWLPPSALSRDAEAHCSPGGAPADTRSRSRRCIEVQRGSECRASQARISQPCSSGHEQYPGSAGFPVCPPDLYSDCPPTTGSSTATAMHRPMLLSNNPTTAAAKKAVTWLNSRQRRHLRTGKAAIKSDRSLGCALSFWELYITVDKRPTNTHIEGREIGHVESTRTFPPRRHQPL